MSEKIVVHDNNETQYGPDPLRLAVIGGGTGSFTALQALKELTPEISALVSMADDGGSSGVLRDELGALPPGDVRQCLVALSDTPHLRDLFSYRFDNGGLAGHSFGNLLLTALEKQTGSFVQAVETASEVLNITGRVVPITLDNVSLALDTSDGRHLEGEHEIDTADLMSDDYPNIQLLPKTARMNPDAESAIERADVIIIAPGDLYTSLAPALLVSGVGEALQRSSALVAYVCNLVVKPGHTEGMGVIEHAAEIERFAGKQILDVVLYNNSLPQQSLLNRYEKDGEYLIPEPLQPPGMHYGLVGAPLVARQPLTLRHPDQSADKLATSRSYIRHDKDLLRQAFTDLLSREDMARQ